MEDLLTGSTMNQSGQGVNPSSLLDLAATNANADTSANTNTTTTKSDGDDDLFADFVNTRHNSAADATSSSSSTSISTSSKPVEDSFDLLNIGGGHKQVDTGGKASGSEKTNDDASGTDSSGSEYETDSSDSEGGGKEMYAAASAGSSSFFDQIDGTADACANKYHEYDVEFEKGPIGLNLEPTKNDKMALVKGFRRLADGSVGPAKLAGVIERGHILVSVSGKSSLGKSFSDIVKMLKAVSGGPHTLRFRDPNMAAQTNFSSSSLEKVRRQSDFKQAMAHIHTHKLEHYKPCAENIEDMVLGFVERYKGDHVTSFHFHRQSDNKFVLAASCHEDMKGMFIFHTMQDMSWDAKLEDITTSKDSATYLGCLAPNFTGTDFTLFDYRISDPTEENMPIHELALIKYEINMLGRVPNSLKVILPRYDDETVDVPAANTLQERFDVQNTKCDDTEMSIFDKLTGATGFQEYGAVEQADQADLIALQTKSPEWNEGLNAWTLNFKGRVKMASKKNFILGVDKSNENLVDEFGESAAMMRFGKVTKDRFALDYCYPLSPIQALAIALTSFSDKLIVT